MLYKTIQMKLRIARDAFASSGLLFLSYEGIYITPCLFQYSTQCSFWQASWMIWHSRISTGLFIAPYLVTAGRLSVKKQNQTVSIS